MVSEEPLLDCELFGETRQRVGDVDCVVVGHRLVGVGFGEHRPVRRQPHIFWFDHATELLCGGQNDLEVKNKNKNAGTVMQPTLPYQSGGHVIGMRNRL